MVRDPNDPTIDLCDECMTEPAVPGGHWCRWCTREAQEIERLEQDRDE
jgi:hypothetical protein